MDLHSAKAVVVAILAPRSVVGDVRDGPDRAWRSGAGDVGRSRSAYCPGRPYNHPVIKKINYPEF